MGEVVPKGRVDKLAFFRVHAPQWAQHAQQLGVPAEQVAALLEKLEATDAARLEQGQALSAARTATSVFNRHLRELGEAGSAILQRIRATAAAEGNNDAYSLALIPPPDGPSKVPPPGTPHSFKSQQYQVGWLKLSWKCRNPRSSTGTVYQVLRQLDGRGKFDFLGITGKKSFLDDTLPAGTREAVYRVTAVRSTAAGLPATYLVRFGVPADDAAGDCRAAA